MPWSGLQWWTHPGTCTWDRGNRWLPSLPAPPVEGWVVATPAAGCRVYKPQCQNTSVFQSLRCYQRIAAAQGQMLAPQPGSWRRSRRGTGGGTRGRGGWKGKPEGVPWYPWVRKGLGVGFTGGTAGSKETPSEAEEHTFFWERENLYRIR